MTRSSISVPVVEPGIQTLLKRANACVRGRSALSGTSKGSRPTFTPQDGFLFLDRAKFAESFAADLDPDIAAFRADSQVPSGVQALGDAVTRPAWRTKPSWYVIATDDRMIPPPAQHAMSKRTGAAVSEVKARHALYESQPAFVATVIERASSGIR